MKNQEKYATKKHPKVLFSYSSAVLYASKIASSNNVRVSGLIGCAISRYPPVAVFLLGIAINKPLSPSIIRISWTAKQSSIKTYALPFIRDPSFSILRTFTDVIFIYNPPF